MEWQIYEDADVFENIARPFLTKWEDRFSLFGGVLNAIQAGLYKDPLMAVVTKKQKVLALLQMTPPHPLNLILIDEQQKELVLPFIIQQLLAAQIQLEGIISIRNWATDFTHLWQEQTGQQFDILMEQGLYRLDRVDPQLIYSEGQYRLAHQQDQSLIAKWASAFVQETALPEKDPAMLNERIKTFIAHQEVFVWEVEGRIVSMMKKSRPTKRGVTVSLVYTPKEERKKGYARSLVAKGSDILLQTYDFCVLYTDLKNPTSNKIYQEIGYQQIAPFIHIGFR